MHLSDLTNPVLLVFPWQDLRYLLKTELARHPECALGFRLGTPFRALAGLPIIQTYVGDGQTMLLGKRAVPVSCQ